MLLQVATKIGLYINDSKYERTNFRMLCYKLLHNFGFADQRLNSKTIEHVIAMLQIATKIALHRNERKYRLTNLRMLCFQETSPQSNDY